MPERQIDDAVALVEIKSLLRNNREPFLGEIATKLNLPIAHFDQEPGLESGRSQ